LFSGCVEKCKQLSTEDEQIECLTSLAIQKSDLNICNNIDNNARIEECTASYAGAQGDLEACPGFTTEISRNKCYMRAAEAARDYTICENITDEYFKEAKCYALVSYKLTRDAKTAKDYSICYTLIGDNAIMQCVAEVNTAVGNALECRNLEFQNLENICNNPAQYENELCQRGIIQAYNACILENEESYCRQKADSLLQGVCIEKGAELAQDTSFCYGLPNESYCMAEVTIAQNNLEECQNLTEKDYCTKGIALKRKDSGVCLQMTEGENDCIREIALVKNDANVCAESTITEEEQACTEAVSAVS